MPFVPRVVLDDQMLADLADLLDARQEWDSVVAAASNTDAADNVYAFSRIVAENSQKDFQTVFAILNGLWNIRRAAVARGETAEAFLSNVRRSMRLNRRIAPEQLAAWDQDAIVHLTTVLQYVTDDSSLMISSKAQFLAYDHERIYRRSRIITDVRPVFDTLAESIRELMVLHTLVVEYDDKEGTKEIHIALDSMDIDDLRGACDRADEKASMLKQHFEAAKIGCRTVIVPDDVIA